MAATFALQFDPAKIKTLAAEYDYADDTEMLKAGKAIKRGEHTLENLLRITTWKSSRSSGRVRRNTEAEASDALRIAVSAKTDRAAIAVLTGLQGIDVPVASAILAAIYPDRFTIIDFRALESLGVKQPSPQVDFYLKYLAHCRELAGKYCVSLRQLDQALWRFSSSSSKRKRKAAKAPK